MDQADPTERAATAARKVGHGHKPARFFVELGVHVSDNRA
jgi:hypothetical protein